MGANIGAESHQQPRGATAAGRSETYQALMQVAWNFDYDSDIAELDDLYHRANESQWIVADLDWDAPIDPGNPIFSSDNANYSRMPFFKRLSKTQRETFSAHSAAQLLSQFLHGEQGALLTAATVAHGVRDMKAKCCAATQTIDEARHVEAYQRYMDRMAMQYPIVPWLQELIDVTLKSNDICKVMIGMNMIVEGLALGALNNMYRQANEPLLQSITFNVMRDESRHVSFGHTYLTPIIAAMHVDDREALAQFAFDAVSILIVGQAGPMDAGFQEVLQVSNIDPEDFSNGLREAAQSGIRNELPPGQVHSVAHLMMPSLARAGLITPRTEALFADVGVNVNVDLRVLEAMVERCTDTALLSDEGSTT